MKVVQINAVYGVGSTGRIVEDIHKVLKKNGHESYVFWAIKNSDTSKDKQIFQIGNVFDHKLHAIKRRIFLNQGFNSKIATYKLCKRIKEISPDIVHLHNLHSNFINLPYLFKFLRTNKIKTLITLHDCWMFTGMCTHYEKWNSCLQWENGCRECPAVNKKRWDKVRKMYQTKKECYSNNNSLYVNGVSRWTTEAAKFSMIHAQKYTCIYNWIDTNVFKPSNAKKKIMLKYNIPEHHKIVLGVSQEWSVEKGLNEFVKLSGQMKNTVTVILVGRSTDIIKRDNLIFIGYTKDQEELAELYSAADLFMNPSRMETFGLVTVEAMACGTPVVAYKNTGTKELITDDTGWLVKDGDIEAMLELVKKILASNQKKSLITCRTHVIDMFEKNRQLKKYLSLYEEICQ